MLAGVAVKKILRYTLLVDLGMAQKHGMWINLGIGVVVGASAVVIYNNFLSPRAAMEGELESYAVNVAGVDPATEPTYASRRFGGYGQERNVFGSIFDPKVRAWTHLTPPGTRQILRNRFRRAVEKGVMQMAADKRSVGNNLDRVRTVIKSQDDRLEELMKSKRLTGDELIAEVNAAIHEILSIFDIPSMQGVSFGMFPK